MVSDSLSALQKRLLRVLAALEPPWTLTGGAALAGIHLGHRTTRDLDLFWRRQGEVGDAVGKTVEVLRREDLEVTMLRTSPAFAQLRVSDGKDVCILDLVAEPFGPIHPPQRVELSGVAIWVDGMAEILINKLTALLGRVELRDLQDVEALLAGGGDLRAALREAPRKDAGFSPLTLSWILEAFDAHALALSLGWSEQDAVAIDRFRRELIEQLTESARPDKKE